MALQKLFDRYSYIKNHQGFKRYFHNTKWLFIAQFSRLIAGFLVGVWVARYFGPTKFGIFSYVLAFTSLFAGIAKLGLDGIIIRDLINEPEKRDIYLGTVFRLKIIGALLVLGLIAIAVQFTSNDAITNLYIFIIASGLIFQSFEVIDFYFQSKVLSKFVSISQMAQIFLSSLLKIYFVLVHAGLIWFVILSGFDQVTLAASLLFAYKYQKLPNFFRYFEWGTAKKLLRNSWPLIFSSIAISIYMRIDQVMIKNMIGNSQLGLYSAAVKLATVWYFVPIIITSSLFPAIVSAKNESRELFYKRLQRLYAFMFWMAIAIVLPMTFFSNYIIKFVYDIAYSGAGEVLMVSIWTGVFVSLGVVTGSLVIVNNKQNYGLVSTSIGAAANIVLNYFLIPIYGIVGAALATLISQVISGFIIPSFLIIDAEYPLIVFRSIFWRNKYGKL